MTFADLIYKAWCGASAHRTKLVGIATSALAYTASQHWMPQNYADGCLFAAGLLAILCGVANTSSIAEKVAAIQNPSQAPRGASSSEIPK
jgi:hypothetical protein